MPSCKNVWPALVFGLFSFCASGESVSLNATNALTLNAAILRTLEKAPGLTASTKAIEVSKAREEQAALGANPSLSVSAQDFLGSGETSGIRALQTTLSLNVVLDNHLLESRSQRARASTALATVARSLDAMDAAAETAHQFIVVLGINELLKENQAVLALTQRSVEIVSAGVEAGRLHVADLHRAQTDVLRAKLEVEDREHELRAAKHLLAANWGSPQPDFVDLHGELDDLPEPLDWSEILLRFDQSPVNEKYLTESRLADTTLALERAATRQPYEYQIGIRHLNEVDDVALVAGISVPLNWKNRNEGNIRATEVQLDVIQARQEAEKVKLRARLFELYENLKHSVYQATVLKQEIIPGLETAVALIEKAYQQGQYSYQELKSVQQELLTTRQLLISTSVQSHLQSIELERLTGTTLSKEHYR